MLGGPERKVHVDNLKPFVRRPDRPAPPRLNTWDVADLDLPTDDREPEDDQAMEDQLW